MANFTPDELERYKEWAESLKGPQMSSLDEALEAQREAQATAELTARGAKGAERPLATLGEIVESVPKATPTLSPAAQSAQVFEEAGFALPKNIAEDIVKKASVAGKSAEESAKILAKKELPALSDYATSAERKKFEALLKQAASEVGSTGEEVIELSGGGKNLPAVTSKQGQLPVTSVSPKFDDVIETTGRTIDSVSEPSRFSKLSKFLPSLESVGKVATALGAAASAYDISKGNLVEGGLTGLETLLGNISPRIAAPLELLRPTATVSQEEEQAELDALRRSNILASLQKRGLAEESVGSGERAVPERPTPLLPDQEGYAVPSRPTPLLSESDRSMAVQGKTPVSIPGGLKPSSTMATPSQAGEPVTPVQVQQERKLTRDRLEEALEQQRQLELMAGISRGSEMLGRGIAGAIAKIQPSKMSGGEFEETLSRLGKQGVEGAKLLRERDKAQFELDTLERKRDPNSAESQMARDFFKKLNIDIPEKASYEALEKFSPQVTKLFDQRENREQRQFLAQQAREAKASKDTEKEKEAIQELTRSFRKELNTGELGKLGTFARKAKSGVKLMEETLKNPSGYKDFAATFALLKATQGDDSVIREAEMKLGLDLGSLPQKTKSKFMQFFTGEMRTSALRKEMLDTMKLLAKRAEDQYLSAADATLYNAEQYNIPRRLLLGQEFDAPSVEKKGKKIIDKGYNSKTNQTQLIYDDGTSEIVEGKK